MLKKILIFTLTLSLSGIFNMASFANTENIKEDTVEKQWDMMAFDLPYGNLKEKKFFREQEPIIKTTYSLKTRRKNKIIGSKNEITSVSEAEYKDLEKEGLKLKDLEKAGIEKLYYAALDRKKEIAYENSIDTKDKFMEENLTYKDLNIKDTKNVRLVLVNQLNNSEYMDNVYYGKIKKDSEDYCLNLKLKRKIIGNLNYVEQEFSYEKDGQAIELTGDEEIIANGKNADYKSGVYQNAEIKIKNLSDNVEFNVNRKNTKYESDNFSGKLELRIDPSSLEEENEGDLLILEKGHLADVAVKSGNKDSIYLWQNNFGFSRGLNILLGNTSGISGLENIQYTLDGTEPVKGSENTKYATIDRDGFRYISIEDIEKETSIGHEGGSLDIKFRLYRGDKPVSKVYKINWLVGKKITSDTMDYTSYFKIKDANCKGDFYASSWSFEWKVFYDTGIKVENLNLTEKMINTLKENKIGRYIPLEFNMIDSMGRLADIPCGYENIRQYELDKDGSLCGWENEKLKKYNQEAADKEKVEKIPYINFISKDINIDDMKTFKNKDNIVIYAIDSEGKIKELKSGKSKGWEISGNAMTLTLGFNSPTENIIIAEKDSLEANPEPDPKPDPDKPSEDLEGWKNDLKDMISLAEDKENIINKKQESIDSLNKEIENAKKALESTDIKAIQTEINNLRNQLNKIGKDESNIQELKDLKKAPKLEPGKYEVYVDMRNYGDQDEESMGNHALVHKAILTVGNNDERYLDFSIHGLRVGEQFGRLTYLWYYDVLTDEPIMKYGNENLGEFRKTKILEYTKGTDLLGSEREFPTKHRIYFNKFKDDPRRYVCLRVDAMDAIDAAEAKVDLSEIYSPNFNEGAVNAIICLDYRTITRIGDLDGPVDTDQPENPTTPIYEELGDIDITKDSKDTEYYIVPVKMMHMHKKDTPSMGNAALKQEAVVKKNKDGYKYYLTFKGIKVLKFYGHLYDLGIYKDNPESEYIIADVDKTMMDKDLEGNEREFPQRLTFTKENKEKEICIKVAVDAMDYIATTDETVMGLYDKNKDKKISYDEIEKWLGSQDAKLVFDWDNAKKLGEEKPNPKPEPKPEPKPSKPSGNRGSSGGSSSVVTTTGTKALERVSGSDRYSTSTRISKKFFKKANTVVLASGVNSADALVSSSLAEINKAPIILSEKNKVNSNLIAELERLGTKEVVIVGGEASISREVQKALVDKGYTVRRIAGADRYATSAKIAQEVKAKTSSKNVILINGQKDADALTVSSLATKNSIPVIMTGNKRLNADAKKKLEEWNPEKLIVIGGTASISDEVYKAAKAQSKIRLAGADRYETAIKIAKESYPNAKNAMLGNGENAIDALSAGAVTKSIKAPILLTGKNVLNPGTKKVIEEYKLNNLYILGGGNTISDKVQEEVKGI